MEGVPIWVGIVVLVLSIAVNSIFHVRKEGNVTVAVKGPLDALAFLLFLATLWFGYTAYGWMGAVGAFLIQLVGLRLGARLLKGR